MYDTLNELGITDIDLIERYTLRQEGDEDILKIYFKRRRGELFAHSVKFRQGRSTKVIPVDSGRGQYKEVSEISPLMLKASEELERIVRRDENIVEAKQRILQDIDHLERVITRKLEQLRDDVERLG
ncbi:MAG: DUF3461 family protein [Gammaproteobacteria bacterium]|nr:DUF3461 family protein [Gammaproteobacteria bacterium]